MSTTAGGNSAIRLDQRFPRLVALADVRLRILRRFYEQAEAHFIGTLQALEKRQDDDVPGNLSKVALSFLDERYEVEQLIDTKRQFAVIGLYTTLERFFNVVMLHLRRSGANIPESKRGMYISEIRAQLQGLGIDIGRPPFRWDEIVKLREIRNCLAHDEGWVDANRERTLAQAGILASKGQYLELPANYFFEAISLVDESCKNIVAECWRRFLTLAP